MKFTQSQQTFCLRLTTFVGRSIEYLSTRSVGKPGGKGVRTPDETSRRDSFTEKDLVCENQSGTTQPPTKTVFKNTYKTKESLFGTG